MPSIRRLANQHPLASYVLLCYLLTWPVWLCLPLLAGADWTLGKILVGIGFGPALAVIILDRLRGTGAAIGTGQWWRRCSLVGGIVLLLDLSSLLFGDGITAADWARSRPPGLSATGVIGALLAATVAGFAFASVAGSRDCLLSSLTDLRRPLRWWLVALLLPAGWMLLGLAIAWLQGQTIGSVDGGLAWGPWLAFVIRAILFTLLVVAVGEEAGWRGWMLPELQKRFSPLLSSILLGVVWGLWHLPLYLNGQYDGEVVLVLAKAGACAFLSILFTWLHHHSGGSLLLAVVLHTALNNTPRLLPTTEAMGLGMMGMVLSVIVFDRMWRRRASPPGSTTAHGTIGGPQ